MKKLLSFEMMGAGEFALQFVNTLYRLGESVTYFLGPYPASLRDHAQTQTARTQAQSTGEEPLLEKLGWPVWVCCSGTFHFNYMTNMHLNMPLHAFIILSVMT
jgi:hypothetical protein